jgi:hypothetical protein
MGLSGGGVFLLFKPRPHLQVQSPSSSQASTPHANRVTVFESSVANGQGATSPYQSRAATRTRLARNISRVPCIAVGGGGAQAQAQERGSGSAGACMVAGVRGRLFGFLKD